MVEATRVEWLRYGKITRGSESWRTFRIEVQFSLHVYIFFSSVSNISFKLYAFVTEQASTLNLNCFERARVESRSHRSKNRKTCRDNCTPIGSRIRSSFLISGTRLPFETFSKPKRIYYISVSRSNSEKKISLIGGTTFSPCKGYFLLESLINGLSQFNCRVISTNAIKSNETFPFVSSDKKSDATPH